MSKKFYLLLCLIQFGYMFFQAYLIRLAEQTILNQDVIIETYEKDMEGLLNRYKQLKDVCDFKRTLEPVKASQF